MQITLLLSKQKKHKQNPKLFLFFGGKKTKFNWNFPVNTQNQQNEEKKTRQMEGIMHGQFPNHRNRILQGRIGRFEEEQIIPKTLILEFGKLSCFGNQLRRLSVDSKRMEKEEKKSTGNWRRSREDQSRKTKGIESQT